MSDLAQPGPFRLGTALFTLVEPHPGTVREYNRWYERDHFYSGMLTFPHVFAGRRWVCTRRLKDLRPPDRAPVPDDPRAGSYLALYWIEAGRHADWEAWATAAVARLHEEGRMDGRRDHVHTSLYELAGWAGRDADPVPPALALDHPFDGLVAVWGGPPPEAGGPVALRISMHPLPFAGEAPGVEQAGVGAPLHLCFLDADPEVAWPALDAAGVVAAARWVVPLVPTVPGTDRYTDELH